MIDRRHILFDEAARTFCFAHEGYLTAAQIMAEHHLCRILVLNDANHVIGTYSATPQGIKFEGAPFPDLQPVPARPRA